MIYRIITMFAVATCLTGTSLVVADTIDRIVIAQNDDAEEDITGPTAGDVRRTSSDLEIGNEDGIEQWIGVRFQHIHIPAGSTINSATIKFTADGVDVGNLLIPIVAEIDLDGEEFGDDTPLTGRVYSSTSVLWDPDPWFPGDCGINTTTPDLSALVQEIVDQPGWTEISRSFVFIFQNDPMDSSERIAVAWDGDPLQAAQLTVDFTPPGILLGDVNRDGAVNLLDVEPFVEVLSTGEFQVEADINLDGVVNLLDVGPFIELLSG